MDPFRKRPHGGRPSYLLVAMFGAVLGIMLVMAAAPYVFSDVLASPPLESVEESDDPENNEQIVPNESHEISSVEFEEAVKNVVDEVGPSIVSVINRQNVRDMWGRDFSQDSQASGVVIDDQGHVVTNYHVIEGARDIIVEDADGNEYSADIVGEDPATDLAVLRIDADFPYVDFADSDEIDAGQLAIAIGNPLGREFARSVTLGVVSGVRSTMYGLGDHERVFELIQTDASINPGNSGGALLDSSGRLIGINTLKFASPEVEGMGFAIPSNTVRRIIDQIIEHGRVERAWLGMTGLSVSDARIIGEDIPEEVDDGVYVDNVLRDSPSWQAGLRPGQIITAVDGEDILNMAEFLSILEEARPGQVMSLEIFRDGEFQVIDVTLGTMPE